MYRLPGYRISSLDIICGQCQTSRRTQEDRSVSLRFSVKLQIPLLSHSELNVSLSLVNCTLFAVVVYSTGLNNEVSECM